MRLAVKINPPTPPLSKRSGGAVEVGETESRSRVEVSKRRVEAREVAVCLAFASRKACRSCRSEAAERVEVDVEATSKRTTFDKSARSCRNRKKRLQCPRPRSKN